MTIQDARPHYQLPPEAYFDPEWYAREQKLIFGQNYNLVGYEVDIPEPGDYLTAMVGAEPVGIERPQPRLGLGVAALRQRLPDFARLRVIAIVEGGFPVSGGQHRTLPIAAYAVPS